MEARNKTVKRGRGRPQARPDEVTRRLIHEAAQQEFLESGYAATCMELFRRDAPSKRGTDGEIADQYTRSFGGIVDTSFESVCRCTGR